MPGQWEEGDCIVGGVYTDDNLVVGISNLGSGVCKTTFTISGMDATEGGISHFRFTILIVLHCNHYSLKYIAFISVKVITYNNGTVSVDTSEPYMALVEERPLPYSTEGGQIGLEVILVSQATASIHITGEGDSKISHILHIMMQNNTLRCSVV